MTNNQLFARIFDYPFADRANLSLNEIVKQNYNNNPVQGDAKRTNPDLHKKDIKEIDNLIRWVGNLVPELSAEMAECICACTTPKLGGVGGFDRFNYKIDSCCGIIYDKGNSVIRHNHFPYIFSFCYYVNTPVHSSPLMLEGKRMRMKEGQLIIFLSYYNHWVPQCKVNGRCVVVGNINYNL